MGPEPGTPAIVGDPAAAITLPTWERGEKVATRVAFGAAIAALAARPEVVVVDGEVGNSTHADEFKKVAPERYFEMYISECQLVATSVGLAVRGYVPFAATFAVFFSHAYDFIRMAGVSQVNVRLVGSHAGVEIGQDGPSQMALEDTAWSRHDSHHQRDAQKSARALHEAGQSFDRLGIAEVALAYRTYVSSLIHHVGEGWPTKEPTRSACCGPAHPPRTTRPRTCSTSHHLRRRSPSRSCPRKPCTRSPTTDSSVT